MAGLLLITEWAAQSVCLRFLPDAGVVAAADAVPVLVSAPISPLLQGGKMAGSVQILSRPVELERVAD